jgi:hypothetical protein
MPTLIAEGHSGVGFDRGDVSGHSSAESGLLTAVCRVSAHAIQANVRALP